jgi:hypothetical protein
VFFADPGSAEQTRTLGYCGSTSLKAPNYHDGPQRSSLPFAHALRSKSRKTLNWKDTRRSFQRISTLDPTRRCCIDQFKSGRFRFRAFVRTLANMGSSARWAGLARAEISRSWSPSLPCCKERPGRAVRGDPRGTPSGDRLLDREDLRPTPPATTPRPAHPDIVRTASLSARNPGLISTPASQPRWGQFPSMIAPVRRAARVLVRPVRVRRGDYVGRGVFLTECDNLLFSAVYVRLDRHDCIRGPMPMDGRDANQRLLFRRVRTRHAMPTSPFGCHTMSMRGVSTQPAQADNAGPTAGRPR